MPSARDAQQNTPIEAKALLKRAARAVGGIVKTKNGRRWDPALHPRDARGRFIETGGRAKVSTAVNGRPIIKTGTVVRIHPNRGIEVQLDDTKQHMLFRANQITMESRPDGSKPIKDNDSDGAREAILDEDDRRTADPKRGDGVKTRDYGDRDNDGVPDEVDADPDDATVRARKSPKSVPPAKDDERADTARKGVSDAIDALEKEADGDPEKQNAIAGHLVDARDHLEASETDTMPGARISLANRSVRSARAAAKKVDDDRAAAPKKDEGREKNTRSAADGDDVAARAKRADALAKYKQQGTHYARDISYQLGRYQTAERARNGKEAERWLSAAEESHREREARIAARDKDHAERTAARKPRIAALEQAAKDDPQVADAIKDDLREAHLGDHSDLPDHHRRADAGVQAAEDKVKAIRQDREAQTAPSRDGQREQNDSDSPALRDRLNKLVADGGHDDDTEAVEQMLADADKAGQDGDTGKRDRMLSVARDIIDGKEQERREPTLFDDQDTTEKAGTNEDRDGVRGAGEGLLDGGAAEGDGGAARPAGVLPEPGTAGGSTGAGRRGGRPAAAGRDGQLVPGAEAVAPGRRSDRRGNGAGRPGVPAAGGPGAGADDTGRPVPDGGLTERTARPTNGAPHKFVHPGSNVVPTDPDERLAANLAVLRLLDTLREEDRWATPEEQAVLARWSGWGALKKVFDENATDPKYVDARAELRKRMTDKEYRAAEKNTLNAHYTDPALVQPMWDALRDLGFDGGDVLEPGSGSGNFIAKAPDGAHMTGVELDPVTASIAQHLYPDAEIHNESFGESPFNDGVFDAVIGNVPFGNFPVFDRVHNPRNRHSIHDHFIIKGLAELKPGGVMAVMTSTFTLDKSDPAARQKMYEYGDLLGAVRLPAGTHADTAGTDVVTDVLVFRKRKPGEARGDDTWLKADTARHMDGSPVLGIKQKDGTRRELTINDYFAVQRPENVLGNIVDGGYNGIAVKKDGDQDTVARLETALAGITRAAKGSGREFDPEVVGEGERIVKRNTKDLREGRIRLVGETRKKVGRKEVVTYKFETVDNGRVVEHTPRGAEQSDQLRRLLGIRDTLADLEAREEAVRDDDDAVAAGLRKALRRQYDEFVKQYGPITQYKETVAEAKYDADGNLVKPASTTRRQPEFGGFRKDLTSADVYALEYDYDPATNTAKTTDIFDRRVNPVSRALPDRVDDPAEALEISLESDGKVDLKRIAGLLGVTEAEARESLRGKVFENPETGSLETAQTYLSGRLLEKVAKAREALADNPAMQENIDALQAAFPKQAQVGEDLHVKLGATYVPIEAYQGFLKHLVKGAAYGHLSDYKVTRNELTGRWTVYAPSSPSARNRDAEYQAWGTSERSVYDLVQAVMNNQHHVMRVEVGTGDKKHYSKAASDEAMAKAAEIAEEFQDWLSNQPGVIAEVEKRYNEGFRSLAMPSWKGSPQRHYDGMAEGKSLRAHQNDAVNRAMSSIATLLEHVVGSGKTYTLAATAMELRRTGQARKPALVVPKPLLGQWAREFKDLYPGAKVLTIDSEDLNGPQARRRFASTVKNGDWDAVVFSSEAFEALPIEKSTIEDYMRKEGDLLRRAVADAQARAAERRNKTTQNAVAKAQNALAKWEAKIESMMSSRLDSEGIAFEKLGIDHIMIDEAHRYKNLPFSTSIEGVTVGDANRAIDMHMKLHALRGMLPQDGSQRVATFATGTPVSNSLAEMYTMTRYLRPDLLEAAGVETFDAWAAWVADVRAKPTLLADGVTMADRPKFHGFNDNLGDMLRIWRTFTDTVTNDDLPYIRLPKMGERKVHITEMSDAQLAVVESAKRRQQKMPKGREARQKGVDTHVALIRDRRAAGLDPRLMSERGLREAGISRDDVIDSPKLDQAADNIADIWSRIKDHEFQVEAKDDSPMAELRGGLQMVMIDTSAPSGGGLNAYQMLKDRLVARGMDPKRIAFVQDAKGDAAKKDAMMEKARQGHYDVIFGSTEALGTGTNVQNRLFALHQLEGSWKPSDIEQREGRIKRQGNQYDEVESHVYVTPGMGDDVTWDLTAAKQGGLDQIRTADPDRVGALEFQDDDESAAYSGIAGAANTNPYVGQLRTVESDLRRLENQERSHQRRINSSKSKIETARMGIRRAERTLEVLRRVQDQVQDTRGDLFTFQPAAGDHWRVDTMGLNPIDSRSAAMGAMLGTVKHVFDDRTFRPDKETGRTPLGYVGVLGGIPIHAEATLSPSGKNRVEFAFHEPNRRAAGSPGEELPIGRVVVGPDEYRNQDQWGALMQGLEYRLRGGMDTAIGRQQHNLEQAQQDLGTWTDAAQRPFRAADALQNARRRKALLDVLMQDGIEVTDADGKTKIEKLDEESRESMKRDLADLSKAAGVSDGAVKKASYGQVVDQVEGPKETPKPRLRRTAPDANATTSKVTATAPVPTTKPANPRGESSAPTQDAPEASTPETDVPGTATAPEAGDVTPDVDTTPDAEPRVANGLERPTRSGAAGGGQKPPTSTPPAAATPEPADGEPVAVPGRYEVRPNPMVTRGYTVNDADGNQVGRIEPEVVGRKTIAWHLYDNRSSQVSARTFGSLAEARRWATRFGGQDTDAVERFLEQEAARKAGRKPGVKKPAASMPTTPDAGQGQDSKVEPGSTGATDPGTGKAPFGTTYLDALPAEGERPYIRFAGVNMPDAGKPLGVKDSRGREVHVGQIVETMSRGGFAESYNPATGEVTFIDPGTSYTGAGGKRRKFKPTDRWWARTERLTINGDVPTPSGDVLTNHVDGDRHMQLQSAERHGFRVGDIITTDGRRYAGDKDHRFTRGLRVTGYTTGVEPVDHGDDGVRIFGVDPEHPEAGEFAISSGYMGQQRVFERAPIDAPDARRDLTDAERAQYDAERAEWRARMAASQRASKAKDLSKDELDEARDRIAGGEDIEDVAESMGVDATDLDARLAKHRAPKAAPQAESLFDDVDGPSDAPATPDAPASSTAPATLEVDSPAEPIAGTLHLDTDTGPLDIPVADEGDRLAMSAPFQFMHHMAERLNLRFKDDGLPSGPSYTGENDGPGNWLRERGWEFNYDRKMWEHAGTPAERERAMQDLVDSLDGDFTPASAPAATAPASPRDVVDGGGGKPTLSQNVKPQSDAQRRADVQGALDALGEASDDDPFDDLNARWKEGVDDAPTASLREARDINFGHGDFTPHDGARRVQYIDRELARRDAAKAGAVPLPESERPAGLRPGMPWTKHTDGTLELGDYTVRPTPGTDTVHPDAEWWALIHNGPDIDEDGRRRLRTRKYTSLRSAMQLAEMEYKPETDGTAERPAAPDADPTPETVDEQFARLGIERHAPVAIGPEKFAPTQQQQDIHDAALAGKDVKVQAKAGTGKTTTLEGLSRRLQERDPNTQVLYIAFNKSVQTEAEGRMPSNTESRTGHSLAFQWAPKWMQDRQTSAGMRRPDEVAAHLGVRDNVKVADGPDLTPREIATAAIRTVDRYATSADDKISAQHLPASIAKLDPNAQKAVLDAANKAWADLSTEGGRIKVTPDHVRKAWALSRPDLTKAGAGNRKAANVLFLDEAQDTPPVLAKVVADQKMQKVIVGDADQAIYGFTGATDYLSTADADVELPLSKSWRYGPPVADIGNRFLTLLGSKGRVEGGGQSAIVPNMDDPDAVLVRSNAGLFAAAMDQIENGRIVGVPKGTKGDLTSLVDTIAYLKDGGPRPNRIHDDLEPFRTWQEFTDEVQRGDDAKLSMIDRLTKRYDTDELSGVVSQLVEDGDGGSALDGVTVNDVDGRMELGGKTWALGERLKKAGHRGIGDGGFRWDGAKKVWYVTGTPEKRQAALDKLRAMDAGDAGAKPDVTVSTAHKAKGLEWGKVKIGDDFQGPKVDEETGETVLPDPEELRLYYVAVTRAEKELDPGSLAWVYEQTEDVDPNVPPAAQRAEVPDSDGDRVTVTPQEMADLVEGSGVDAPTVDATPEAVDEPETPDLVDAVNQPGQLDGQQMLDVDGGFDLVQQTYVPPKPKPADPRDVEGQQTIDDVLDEPEAADAAEPGAPQPGYSIPPRQAWAPEEVAERARLIGTDSEGPNVRFDLSDFKRNRSTSPFLAAVQDGINESREADAERIRQDFINAIAESSVDLADLDGVTVKARHWFAGDGEHGATWARYNPATDTIWISAHTPASSDQYVMLHELGHRVDLADYRGKRLGDRTPADMVRDERAADEYADKHVTRGKPEGTPTAEDRVRAALRLDVIEPDEAESDVAEPTVDEPEAPAPAAVNLTRNDVLDNPLDHGAVDYGTGVTDHVNMPGHLIRVGDRVYAPWGRNTIDHDGGKAETPENRQQTVISVDTDDDGNTIVGTRGAFGRTVETRLKPGETMRLDHRQATRDEGDRDRDVVDEPNPDTTPDEDPWAELPDFDEPRDTTRDDDEVADATPDEDPWAELPDFDEPRDTASDDDGESEDVTPDGAGDGGRGDDEPPTTTVPDDPDDDAAPDDDASRVDGPENGQPDESESRSPSVQRDQDEKEQRDEVAADKDHEDQDRAARRDRDHDDRSRKGTGRLWPHMPHRPDLNPFDNGRDRMNGGDGGFPDGLPHMPHLPHLPDGSGSGSGDGGGDRSPGMDDPGAPRAGAPGPVEWEGPVSLDPSADKGERRTAQGGSEGDPVARAAAAGSMAELEAMAAEYADDEPALLAVLGEMARRDGVENNIDGGIPSDPETIAQIAAEVGQMTPTQEYVLNRALDRLTDLPEQDFEDHIKAAYAMVPEVPPAAALLDEVERQNEKVFDAIDAMLGGYDNGNLSVVEPDPRAWGKYIPQADITAMRHGHGLTGLTASRLPEEITRELWGMTPDEMRQQYGTSRAPFPVALVTPESLRAELVEAREAALAGARLYETQLRDGRSNVAATVAARQEAFDGDGPAFRDLPAEHLIPGDLILDPDSGEVRQVMSAKRADGVVNVVTHGDGTPIVARYERGETVPVSASNGRELDPVWGTLPEPQGSGTLDAAGRLVATNPTVIEPDPDGYEHAMGALKGAHVRAVAPDGRVLAGEVGRDSNGYTIGGEGVDPATLSGLEMLSGVAEVPGPLQRADSLPDGARVRVEDEDFTLGRLPDGSVELRDLGARPGEGARVPGDTPVSAVRAHRGPLEQPAWGGRPGQWTATDSGAVVAKVPDQWQAVVAPSLDGDGSHAWSASAGNASASGDAPSAAAAKNAVATWLADRAEEGANRGFTAMPYDRPSSTPAADSQMPETDPGSIGGRRAEWVDVTSVNLGDTVRVTGRDMDGNQTTEAGYALSSPTMVQVHRQGVGYPEDLVALVLSDDLDGRSGRRVVLVPPGTAAARAVPNLTGPDSIHTPDAPESEVLSGRVADYVPTGQNGVGLFPASEVVDPVTGRRGVVIAARQLDASVKWEDGETSDVNGVDVRVDTPARPLGWTADGKRIMPGHVATFTTGTVKAWNGNRDERMRGTVSFVDDDMVTVMTPAGLRQVPADQVQVMGRGANVPVVGAAHPVDEVEAPAGLFEPIDGPLVAPALTKADLRALIGLGFDLDEVSDPSVAEAAARLRHGAPISRDQAAKLAGAVVDARGAADADGAWGRTMDRLAAALTGASEGRITPRQVTVDDITPGDHVAIPRDGGVDVVRVEQINPTSLDVVDQDGVPHRIAYPDEMTLVPDPPAPQVDAPAPEVRDLTAELRQDAILTQRAQHMRDTATMVGQLAADAAGQAQSIGDLRERVGAALNGDPFEKRQGAARRQFYATLTRAGIVGDERSRILAETKHSTGVAADAVREAVLRTINDAEPLPGESWETSRARIGRLITDAARNAGQDSAVTMARGDLSRINTQRRVNGQGPVERDDLAAATRAFLEDTEVQGMLAELTEADRLAAQRLIGAAAADVSASARREARRVVNDLAADRNLTPQKVQQVIAELHRIQRVQEAAARRAAAGAANRIYRSRGGARSTQGRSLAFKLGAWLGTIIAKAIEQLGNVLRGLTRYGFNRDDARTKVNAALREHDVRAAGQALGWRNDRPWTPGGFGRVPARGARYVTNRRTPAGVAPTLRQGWNGALFDRDGGDGGPGRAALGHLDHMVNVGAILDKNTGSGALVAEAVRLRAAADAADRAARESIESGDVDEVLVDAARSTRRLADDAYRRAAADEGRRALAALRQRRSMGEADGAHVNLEGDEQAVAAARWALGHFPTDWIAALGQEPITVKVGERGEYAPATRTMTVTALGDSHLPEAGPYGANALHELTHAFESVLPDLGAAQWVYHHDRTSEGVVGARTRTGNNATRHLSEVNPNLAWDADEVTRVDQYPHPYMGREYGGMQHFEVMSMLMESLFGGSTHITPQMRQFALGVLAEIGVPR